MALKAYSLQNQILIELPGGTEYRIERRDGREGALWLVLTDSGYVPDNGG